MYNWKAVITMMLSGSLFACSSMTQDLVKSELNPQIEQSVDDLSKVEATATENEKLSEAEVKFTPVENARKTSDGKLILGEEEWVFFPGLKQTFKARIDTGATTSSISAVDINNFERDGKDWVKFKIEHAGITTEEISLPVERWVKIKQSNAQNTQRRPVVVASIQVGNLKDKTEFTLADRTHLSFPLLLGRRFFRGVAIIDVSKKYVQEKVTK